jgi:protein AaeX
MILDINLFGLFLNAGLVAAIAAALAMWPLRKLLAFAGAYKWVWHPALVDLCLFVLLWCAFATGLRAGLFPFFSLLLG